MSDEGWTIRREEWQKVVDTLGDIKQTLVRMEERENARDDRVIHAQSTADRALAMAQDNSTRLTTIEANTGHNTQALDDWKGLVFRVAAGVKMNSRDSGQEYERAAEIRRGNNEDR